MTYLNDLIERIGNALGIKSKTPSTTTDTQAPPKPTTAS
jgi:hypothetical protein